MTQWEYTYLWWEGSATSTASGKLGPTTDPIGEEVMDKLNALGTDGWEIADITAAPLTTGWISPRGGTAAAGFTDKVHYVAILRRPQNRLMTDLVPLERAQEERAYADAERGESDCTLNRSGFSGGSIS